MLKKGIIRENKKIGPSVPALPGIRLHFGCRYRSQTAPKDERKPKRKTHNPQQILTTQLCPQPVLIAISVPISYPKKSVIRNLINSDN